MRDCAAPKRVDELQHIRLTVFCEASVHASTDDRFDAVASNQDITSCNGAVLKSEFDWATMVLLRVRGEPFAQVCRFLWYPVHENIEEMCSMEEMTNPCIMISRKSCFSTNMDVTRHPEKMNSMPLFFLIGPSKIETKGWIYITPGLYSQDYEIQRK
jgi:hypothetical protein